MKKFFQYKIFTHFPQSHKNFSVRIQIFVIEFVFVSIRDKSRIREQKKESSSTTNNTTQQVSKLCRPSRFYHGNVLIKDFVRSPRVGSTKRLLGGRGDLREIPSEYQFD